MRIIAGQFRRRQLLGPPDDRVRPTSDRLRETLFNVLADSIVGLRVLDLCAGTGAVGLEALSRGAATVTFVERDSKMLAVLGENIIRCGVDGHCEVIRADARSVARAVPDRFDLVWLDPPYDDEAVDEMVAAAADRVAAEGRLLVEHRRRRDVGDGLAGFERFRVVTAGDSAISFLRRAQGGVDLP